MKKTIAMDIVKANTDISYIKTLLSYFDHLEKNGEKETILKYYDKLKENNFNEFVIRIILPMRLDKKITVLGKLNLVDRLRESNYNKDYFDLMLDDKIFDVRSYEDYIKLLDKFKDCSYNPVLKDLFTSYNVLLSLSTKEQLELIDIINNVSSHKEYFVSLITSSSTICTNILEFLGFDKLKKIVEVLEETNYSEVAVLLASNPDLWKISFNKYLSLMKTFANYEYDENILSIITDENVLKNRTVSQIKRLVDLRVKSENKGAVERLICDRNLLIKLDTSTQIKVINKLEKLNYNSGSVDVACDSDVLNKMNLSDMFRLMEKISESEEVDFREVRLAIDPQILNYRTIDEIIMIIDKYRDTGRRDNVYQFLLSVQGTMNFDTQMRHIDMMPMFNSLNFIEVIDDIKDIEVLKGIVSSITSEDTRDYQFSLDDVNRLKKRKLENSGK